MNIEIHLDPKDKVTSKDDNVYKDFQDNIDPNPISKISNNSFIYFDNLNFQAVAPISNGVLLEAESRDHLGIT